MRFSLPLLAIGSLLGVCFAEEELHSLTDLAKRQSGAFIPSSQSTTCAANLKCGTSWCLRPGRGDLCCSEGYACPSTSFCLTKGYCCPLGLSIEACALNNKVTLPVGFNTATIAAGAATAGGVASGAASGAASSVASSAAGVPLFSPSLRSTSLAASTGLPTTTTTFSSFAGGLFGRTSSSSSIASQFTGAANVAKQAAEGLVMAAAAIGYFV